MYPCHAQWGIKFTSTLCISNSCFNVLSLTYRTKLWAQDSFIFHPQELWHEHVCFVMGSQFHPTSCCFNDGERFVFHCASSVKMFCWNIPLLILIFHPEDLGAGRPGPNNFCSSSTEGPPRTWQPGETNDQINLVPSLRRQYLMIFLLIILQCKIITQILSTSTCEFVSFNLKTAGPFFRMNQTPIIF